jgi:hypothetical protein
VLAARAPGLREALERALAAGTPYVILDGKVVDTDNRCQEKTSEGSSTFGTPGRRMISAGSRDGEGDRYLQAGRFPILERKDYQTGGNPTRRAIRFRRKSRRSTVRTAKAHTTLSRWLLHDLPAAASAGRSGP